MNLRKMTIIGLSATLFGATLTGCSSNNYDLECDQGDQIEHDSDCGYVDSNNQWIWYSWVQQGQVSHSPDDWEPPAGVTVQQEDEEGEYKVKKPKKKSDTKTSITKVNPVKPAPKIAVPKAAPAKRK